MLLKISDGNGGWHLFDGVEQAYMIALRKKVNSVDELSHLQLVEGEIISLVAKECFQQASVDVGVIEFTRKGVKQNVMFTKVAYFCNDNGHTVEKMTVGRNP